jgi:hypothetical protein
MCFGGAHLEQSHFDLLIGVRFAKVLVHWSFTFPRIDRVPTGVVFRLLDAYAPYILRCIFKIF